VRRGSFPVPRTGVVAPDAHNPGRKTRAAGLSIISNSALIVLKIGAGVLTGSIALITEAIHSAVDLVASVVAFFSVRKADQPADADHLYGHAKVENLAAALEGVLIVLGAAVIIFESVRRLADPPELESLGVGIAVIALSMVVNLGVSTYLYRQAHAHDSPALEGDAAHLRTDALTSFGVLIGLVLVQVTGVDALDPAVALVVACAIIFSGVRIVSRSSRVLVDEALPPDELDQIRDAIESNGAPEIYGFHKLRARRAGSNRYIDLHVQFRRGTTLERAHALSHDLSESIRKRVRGADVLVHLEPEDTALREAPERDRTGASAKVDGGRRGHG
jgi:cation diffusion facilitator family transporter